jgi:hypothetical protein
MPARQSSALVLLAPIVRRFLPAKRNAMSEKKHEPAKEEKGSMTVEEAGRLGGHKGGQRERELVEKGHQVEQQQQQHKPPATPKGKH